MQSVGCLRLPVILRKRAINYRVLLRKMTYKDKASCGSSRGCSRFAMYECMYAQECVCIYIHIHTYVCIHTRVCTYTYTRTSCWCWLKKSKKYTQLSLMHIYIYIYINTCISYIHIYVCIYMYIYIRWCMCEYTRISSRLSHTLRTSAEDVVHAVRSTVWFKYDIRTWTCVLKGVWLLSSCHESNMHHSSWQMYIVCDSYASCETHVHIFSVNLHERCIHSTQFVMYPLYTVRDVYTDTYITYHMHAHAYAHTYMGARSQMSTHTHCSWRWSASCAGDGAIQVWHRAHGRVYAQQDGLGGENNKQKTKNHAHVYLVTNCVFWSRTAMHIAFMICMNGDSSMTSCSWTVLCRTRRAGRCGLFVIFLCVCVCFVVCVFGIYLVFVS